MSLGAAHPPDLPVGALAERSLPKGKAARAHYAALLLHEEYGSPRHGNKDDPLDELVYIVLSQMTTQASFSRVFDRLKHEFPDWNGLLEIPLSQLKELITDAGLSNQKAPRIASIVRKILNDFWGSHLDLLQSIPASAVEGYLVSLPGVGTKTAKCVMMYSLGHEVLPVDTHVYRIARRLGLVGNLPPTKFHGVLEAVIAPADRYAFHVNGVAHGRKLCRPRNPLCGECPIRSVCRSPHRLRP